MSDGLKYIFLAFAAVLCIQLVAILLHAPLGAAFGLYALIILYFLLFFPNFMWEKIKFIYLFFPLIVLAANISVVCMVYIFVPLISKISEISLLSGEEWWIVSLLLQVSALFLIPLQLIIAIIWDIIPYCKARLRK